MDKIIRWGIWGTGAIAQSVAEDFALVQGAVLHAVASRTVERAQHFAARHGAAKHYGRLEQLLGDPEVDVVYIATPNDRHVGDCLACIQAGKAVMCEKPFALNVAEAQQIVDAARGRKVFCMEAMWTRFIPAVMEAKRSIDAGAIGPVRLIQGNFAHLVPEGSTGRLFSLEQGGGALLDLGVYLVSLAHHLLGVPQTVRGTASLGASGVDEQSAYQLGYANGAMADLAASFHVRGTNELVIFGERGAVRLKEPFYSAHRMVLQSYARPQATVQDETPSQGPGLAASLRGAPLFKSLRRRLSSLEAYLKRGRARSFPFAGNGYQFELLEVNNCVREQRTESAIMPLNDSLDVMRTMDALRSQWGLVYPQEQSGRETSTI